MNKLLLATLISATCGTGAVSANKLYTADVLSDLVKVSDNGRFVACGDTENSISYLWDSEKPEEFTSFGDVKIEVYDVSDNGEVVGALYETGGKWRSVIYRNGEWEQLPLHSAVMNTTAAVAITPDGSVIGGYQFLSDPDSEIAGRYYPCRWLRNSDGDYELEIYTELELPAHQGFYVTCMNKEGSTLGGRLYCGAGSTIPALVKDGELIIWNTLTSEMRPVYYKGQVIGEVERYFIDGYQDGYTGEYFVGEFDYCDAMGNFYGARTKASNVHGEEGEGTLTNYACIYNEKSGDWTDSTDYSVFGSGIGTDYIFAMNGKVIHDGEAESATTMFDVTAPKGINMITGTSDDGQVLAGQLYELNAASGEYQYYPFVIVLDEPLVSGVENVISGKDNAVILVSAGRIDVAGAEKVAVYDMNGRLVSTQTTSHVAPGVYAVKAGKTTRKVIVK